MFKNPFCKTIPFLLFIVLLYSCDKEFNGIGDELIEDSSLNLEKLESNVVAYNQKIDVVQSNNLPVNALGVYNDPSFGITTANFATQLVLASTNPIVPSTAKVKSVVLTIPYFYNQLKTVNNSDGSHAYVLDSIYGSANAKIKLSVYESGYFMRNLDPADQFLKPQKYYNNQNSDFNNIKVGDRLNNDDSGNNSQNDQFFFDPSEYPIGKAVASVTKTPPAMRLNLSTSFFQTKFVDAPVGSLATNDAFMNYFKGLYFQVEPSGSTESCLGMLNFKAGIVTIVYSETADDPVEKTIILNMTGNTVSLLEHSNDNPDYVSATNAANVNTVTGDDNLYLKGGAGSMAVIDLFKGVDNFGPDGVTGTPNSIADELDIMRTNKYLINEATLVFHVNKEKMSIGDVAKRIYLYDFTNKQVISDYNLDGSLNAANIKNSKFIYGGMLTKGAKPEDLYYKFTVTKYIRYLVKNPNVKEIKLGLVVTEDITKFNFYSAFLPGNVPEQIPMASIMSPLGVILYGGTSSTSVPADKKLKLMIYYTKPN